MTLDIEDSSLMYYHFGKSSPLEGLQRYSELGTSPLAIGMGDNLGFPPPDDIA